MFDLPITYLLIISFLFSVMSYIVNSLFAKKISSTGSDFYFFMAIQAVVCGITILILSGGIGIITSFSILFGILFGAVCTFQNLSYLRALAIGPFSYTTVIVSLSAVIPTLSGCIFWNEKISAGQIVGIVLMVICIALSPDNQQDTGAKKASFKWIVLSLVSAILNGAVGVLQKIHQTSEHKEELPVFLISAFVVMFTIAVCILIARKIKYKNSTESNISFKFKLSHILILLGAGVSLGFAHVVNLFLSGKLPAAVLFPIINICPLVLTTAAATVIFRERLSTKRWIGLAVGILSTLFVGGVIAF